MAYTVFARKYRPQTFDQLVGQEHVAQTLSNAISADRVAHAFLFTGVRGVGKTTTARILAKAINCERGPTANPCNECTTCTEITAGIDMDVQEIDGASNNGVDDVRRLQESLPFRPARDRFKVVIVDEVHMLSTGAFNAFLKTLEEPPAHVKFVFATTEIHKVPVTIRSRCQRYDFRLIPRATIAQRVGEILEAEGVEADAESIALVAREAAGSMRDALTLLDQAVAFAGNTLVGSEVTQALGVAPQQLVRDVTDAMLGGDGRAVISGMRTVAEQGADLVHFAQQLTLWLRDLIVLNMSDDGSVVDLAPDELDAALAQARSCETLELQRTFAGLSTLVEDLTRAAQPRVILEMGLMRLATRPRLQDIGRLLSRLEQLERRLEAGSPGAGSPGAGSPGTGSSGTNNSTTRDSRTSSETSETRSTSTVAEPHPVDTSTAVKRAMALAGSKIDSPAGEATTTGETTTTSETIESHHSNGHATNPVSANFGIADGVAPDPRRSAVQEWEELISSLRDDRPGIAAVLQHAVPRVVSGDRVVLSFQKGSFYGRKATAPETTEAIETAIFSRFGTKPEVKIRFDADERSAERSVAVIEAKRRDARKDSLHREAIHHPIVREALQLFPASQDHVDVRVEADA